MKRLILSIVVVCCLAPAIAAQEPARYRITYDCDAQVVPGQTLSYRWTLDIGEASAVFYNESSRAFSREMAKLTAGGDLTALMNELPLLGQKYPAKSDLQILIGSPERGRYTYCKQVLASKLKYDEPLPAVDWQLSDGTQTICEYECRKATATVYGRTWTVWYAMDLPLNYGPYVLQGLPGLILAARDSEGLFNFEAVGIEEAPKDAEVSIYNDNGYQSCTRKRFLEIRGATNGISVQQIAQRVAGQYPSGTVITLNENGENVAGQELPANNYLDIE